MRSRTLEWTVLVWMMQHAAAYGQSSLTVQEAVSRALGAHPALSASEGRVAASEGLQLQAGLMPNPRLILQTENTRPYGNPAFQFWRDTDNFAFLQQPIETGGKRNRRVEAASLAVERAERERDVLRWTIAARVRQAYWQAAGARRIYDLFAETVRNFGQVVEYHELRVREGAMAEVDLIRIRLEAERLAIAANAASLEADRARIALFREMGATEFPAVTYADPLDQWPGAIPAPNVEQALENRPDLRLARTAVEASRRNVALQRANATPNVDLVFGWKRTSGLDTMIGGLQWDLPFLNRNQGNVAAAGGELRAAEASLAAASALARAEVNSARADYEIRRRQVTQYLGTLRDRAAESQRIAQAAYREGGSDLLRLLDAERTQIEAQVLYYRTLAEYRQSIAALESAMGVIQ
ncbi:MAG: TolC family protein [Bryobacteraceae bacterium]|nr:TolC family protein [Bryobacteraceae bacterium]